jgi:putative exosortase-associated protein (TIGR04073 family)
MERKTTMLMPRLHRAVLAAGFAAVLLGGATPAIADDTTAPAITKLTRGVVNVALGLPGEIVLRVVSSAHSEAGLQSGSSYIAGLLSGLVMGVAWGAVRVESGMIDVVTFPIPFNDNRPLFEPDYPL